MLKFSLCLEILQAMEERAQRRLEIKKAREERQQEKEEQEKVL
jgi:hypothetical protein